MLGDRLTFVIAGLLVACHVALAVGVARDLGPVVDEEKYFNAGRIALKGQWDLVETRLHGPLPYYATQLFVGEASAEGYDPRSPGRAQLLRGRLGTLPFGILGAVLVFLWARRVFGNMGGLVSLTLFALNPLTVGYGGLVMVDIAHSVAVLATLFCLWRLVLAFSWRWVALLGTLLGVAFATKYIALLIGPPVALAAALRVWWVTSRPGRTRALHLRGAGAALATCLAIASISLVVLYACYGFGVWKAQRDSTVYRSRFVAELVETPVVGSAATLLPEPFLLGVDFQKRKAEQRGSVFLDGVFGEGHGAYYFRSFLYKTPELVIALTIWLFLFQVPMWLRGRGRPGERACLWVIVPVMGGLFVYLSFFTGLQLGIRYALPLYPLLFVLLGSAGRTIAAVPISMQPVWGLLAVLGGFHLLEVGENWPNLIGYYNRSAGGQAAAYRHFRDSNSDYGQYETKGERLLEETETHPFDVLHRSSGPRFGRLAVRLRDLDRVDPRDRSRSRFDWVERGTPTQNVGACWWLFDVTPTVLEAAVEDDPRLREDLVVAYLGAGRIGDAHRHLELLEDDAPSLARLVQLVQRAAAGDEDRRTLEALILAWADFGRSDLALELIRERPELGAAPACAVVLAEELAREGGLEEAIAILEATDPETSWPATRALAQLFFQAERYEDSVAVLERYARVLEDPRATSFLRRVRRAVERKTRYLAAAG